MTYQLSDLQTKGAVLNGLMSSKNTSSIISDALSSPMGSTSRKRALKIVNLMKKYRANDIIMMDGQGGPGYGEMPQQGSQMQGELVIFPSPPPMRKAGQMDGQGGPGESNFETMAWAVPRAVASIPGNLIDITKNNAEATKRAIEPAMVNLGNFAQGVGNYLGAPSGTTFSQANPQPFTQPTVPPVQTQPTAPTNSPFSIMTPGQGSANIPWRALAPSTTDLSQYGGSFGSGTGATSGTAGGTQPTQPSSASYLPQPGTTGTPGQDPQTQGAYPAIQNAVNANQGPDAFALSMLSNPESLGGLPGFENMPASARPTGVSLGNQIEQLSDTLKQEMGLDSLLTQKNQMLKSGVTLTTDMSDYIRGRDQFLNQTQGMIDQYTDKMRTMDLANPNVAGRANQYMNYLYELRGRQNKRYIEFLNGSIGAYNAQLTEVSNNYDRALSAYESEFTLKANIKQTEYQMAYTALTGMYNAAQQAPLLQKQMEVLEAQRLATLAAAAADGSNVGNTYITDANNIQTKAKGFVDEKTGFLLPTVQSLSGFINTIADGGNDSPTPQNAMEFAVGAMEGELRAAPDANTAQTLSKKYLGWAVELYRGALSEQEQALVIDLRTKLSNSLADSLTSILTNDTNTLSSLRSDISNMLAPSLFSKGPNQKDFVTKYGPTLGNDVANSLWGGVAGYKVDNGAIDLPPITEAYKLADILADIAASGHTTNIWNTALAQTNH